VKEALRSLHQHSPLSSIPSFIAIVEEFIILYLGREMGTATAGINVPLVNIKPLKILLLLLLLLALPLPS